MEYFFRMEVFHSAIKATVRKLFVYYYSTQSAQKSLICLGGKQGEAKSQVQYIQRDDFKSYSDMPGARLEWVFSSLQLKVIPYPIDWLIN